MNELLINLAYLIAAVLFILGLKGLTHPRTAVRGNTLSAVGMLIAIVASMLARNFHPGLILVGLVIGSLVGGVLAMRIQMTNMPQLVALFNGLGGSASVLVAGGFLSRAQTTGFDVSMATAASGMIGAITFSGSLVAYGKLQELTWVKDWRFPGIQAVNAMLAVTCLALAVLLIMNPTCLLAFWGLVAVSVVLGILLVIPIGGADMPVVIALLNSYSGLAAAATGFVLGNNVLIIAGSLVGASGLILTRIMCVAMNRSLVHVLFGTLQPAAGSDSNDDETYATVKSTSAEEVAMLLEVSSRVAIIPGYGMAVAQAQHAVRDLTNLLIERGVDVEFGIHPVAGRMPGHMNVLLAEADIAYERLLEMTEINANMGQVDLAIVLGANDVVNPSARTDPQSPIAGMPIIDVDKARSVIVIKRSLSPGFAGISNPLFAATNTMMLFGDGRQAVMDITKAIQES